MKPRNRKTNLPSKKKKNQDHDDFFESAAKRRRKAALDEAIESDDSDEDAMNGGETENGEDENGEVEETADEKRVRVATEHLAKIRALAKKIEEEEEEEDGEREDEREGKRDSVVDPIPEDGFRVLIKHRQPVTAVCLSDDDSRGFSASKDGSIMHWDVQTGQVEKYLWPSEDILISHYAKAREKPSEKRSKHVLALAVSSDGRYLASGGLDRHVHLWDVRSREHIQAFHGHRGPVSCLAFRQGTSQLFSGSFDRTIKLWNAEDRTHLDNLFGHQSEILTIDCLRKERLLTAGRDRTMRLWKVPEESQLVYRAPAASLECSCFINDSEFLSGSDDGSLELWGIMRKKPSHIVKNAHPIAPSTINQNIPVENGTKEATQENVKGKNGLLTCSSAQSWVSSVAVCRGSDLAASGAASGTVRLWALEPESRGIHPLYNFPLDGFVNSLTFAKSGRFLLAGVGQEPRLGRWGRVRTARNGVAIHPIRLKEENKTA
ncbi:U3 small nucleolar RNA-interacting protein 2-like protein [Carex littledalei]|uniref:U3 small nucleolar RNA-interacting protein 2-like protein n=1 Tax=Carex littledalei TaxID=544730 RepID=A0A833QJT1_9POAL|nr:U3 small nucleolar RNA-interacting protein 2-like protein [Carex littledalei]